MKMNNSILNVSPDTAIKITYGALFSIVGILLGFSAWMTSMELKAQERTDNIVKIQAQSGKVEDSLMSIDKRLYRIEILLEKQSKLKLGD